jgi:hypothetical protein
MKETFDNLLEALHYFNEHIDFVAFDLKKDWLVHPLTKAKYSIKGITFIKTYKFEEASDADDTSVLHIVRVSDLLKGFFIDGSGAYSDLDI